MTTPIYPEVELSPNIFRAYDIRGKLEEELTTAVAYWIGRAFAAHLLAQQQNCLNLAWDGRLSSPSLAEAFQQGVLEAGVSVNRLGAFPTGLLYFSTHVTDCPNGMMITGSHNPINYNGFKPVVEQQSLTGEEIQSLYQRICQKNLPKLAKSGELKQVDLSASYLTHIVQSVSLERPLKVVVDAGNGIAGPLAIKLFSQLNLDVTFLYCDVDGRFPNHHPDPGVEENLQVLKQTVVAQQADLGLAFDGDGDRVALVDNQGKLIWPDRLLMLLCADLLPNYPQAKVIYDVKTTKHLAQWVEQLGGQAIMTPTGHSIMKRLLKQHGALLGGEFSGHIYIQERWFGFDDGLYAAARLLESLSKRSQRCAEVFAAFPEEFSTAEIGIEVSETTKFQIIERLRQDTELLAQAKVFAVDGLRLEFADGWGLVRASNTTPKLTLRFAGDSVEAVERIKQHFRSALERVMESSITF